MEHELEKLLGGFAADMLTAEERQLLYRAALQDQRLFNALADEQALKELLADPQVRQTLLAALKTTATQASKSASWMDWFRRPMNLALAGGLASAIIAIVLGTKIYQDSLKHAAQSIATETSPVAPPPTAPPASQPTPPHPAEPQSKAKQNSAPAIDLAKKDTGVEQMVKRERSAPSKPQEEPVSDVARDGAIQRSEQDQARRQAEVPAAALGKTAEDVTAAADQKLAAGTAPPAAAPMQQPRTSNAPSAPLTSELKSVQSTAGAVTPTVSARALFYEPVQLAAEAERFPGLAQDIRPGAGAFSDEPRKEKKRAERKHESAARRDGGKQMVPSPVGIRYSLIMKGPGGIDMEVDPGTPIGKDDAPRLAIQANEDGYLSVLSRHPPNAPMVLFPSAGDGHVPRLTNVAIVLASLFVEQPAAEQAQLLVVFSRTPHDTGKAALSTTIGHPLLIERIDPSRPDAPPEQAVYVVDPNPVSAASLEVEIPLLLRP